EAPAQRGPPYKDVLPLAAPLSTLGGLILSIGIRRQHLTGNMQLQRHLHPGYLDRDALVERPGDSSIEPGLDHVVLSLLNGSLGFYRRRTTTGGHGGLDDDGIIADIGKVEIMRHGRSLLDLAEIIGELLELQHIFGFLGLLSKNTCTQDQCACK